MKIRYIIVLILIIAMPIALADIVYSDKYSFSKNYIQTDTLHPQDSIMFRNLQNRSIDILIQDLPDATITYYKHMDAFSSQEIFLYVKTNHSINSKIYIKSGIDALEIPIIYTYQSDAKQSMLLAKLYTLSPDTPFVVLQEAISGQISMGKTNISKLLLLVIGVLILIGIAVSNKIAWYFGLLSIFIFVLMIAFL